MEKLFSLEYGIGGICVLLTLMVLIKVGEFLWRLYEKKERLSEKAVTDLTLAMQENTTQNKHLECRLKEIETSVQELPKLRMDLRRFYAAVKHLAGDKWPSIRDEIMKDDFVA